MASEHLFSASELIITAAKKHLLKKAVLSKPHDKTLIKIVLSEKSISASAMLQAECFHKDNKVTHKNMPLDELSAESLLPFSADFDQINIITTVGDAEYKCSSSGKTVLLNEKKLRAAIEAATSAETVASAKNNRQKNYILNGSEPFLQRLGVSDIRGRVYDKKQSKFKQINRFLEIIRDVEDKLPSNSISVCDLCCGKSYLSFAAYHYFSVIKGMQVEMYVVDLKPDVIKYCTELAAELRFDGLHFICGDINEFTPPSAPSLVISLHACDIATDIVLENAVRWGAEVILSTPCCHHELNHNINCNALDFITEHSMLRQKLCDAATDALRLARLEAKGYITSAVELIDPNETPKNIMLRAYKNHRFDPTSKQALTAMEKYNSAKLFLCGETDPSKLHF